MNESQTKILEKLSEQCTKVILERSSDNFDAHTQYLFKQDLMTTVVDFENRELLINNASKRFSFDVYYECCSRTVVFNLLIDNEKFSEEKLYEFIPDYFVYVDEHGCFVQKEWAEATGYVKKEDLIIDPACEKLNNTSFGDLLAKEITEQIKRNPIKQIENPQKECWQEMWYSRYD